MPNLLMTTQARIEQIASEYGLDSRATDNLDGVLDTAVVNAMIDRASVWVVQRLSQRYSQEQLAGSNPPTSTPSWVSWVVAIVACYYLDTRRFNPGHSSIVAAHEEIKADLDKLAMGTGFIPGVEEEETKPVVVNYVVDHRFRDGPIRRVPHTSTGSRPPSTVKDLEAPYSGDDIARW